MINELQNFFGYSRKEAIGFLLLSVILIIVVVLPFLFDLFIDETTGVSPEDTRILDSLVNVLEQKPALVFFDFDPNRLPEDSMHLLGLKPPVAETWKNYRNKGGVFHRKEDFKKIYGLTPEDYEALAPYIEIPQKTVSPPEVTTPDQPAPAVTQKEPKLLDINTANPEDLLVINGIGQKLSERIIKFRNLLGGYINETQFKEVYYLEGDALENLRKHVYISGDFKPHKINLNVDSYKGIIKHPYIDKEMADKLFKIRRSEDSLITPEKLEDLLAGKDSLRFVLLPYVDF